MTLPWIGTAGWSIPRQHAAAFPGEGTHLSRYAGRFTATEINSSFYRPHRPSTYARWTDSVPQDFRFAVKMPREITHVCRLVEVGALLDEFLSQVGALGARLGPLLVQLPPSLDYAGAVVAGFFESVRARFGGDVACEPRHSAWFTDEVDAMLSLYRVARVAADPAPVPRAALPGGWAGLTYRRLHGSPRMYYTAYPPDFLDMTAQELRGTSACQNWCIFDNTAAGEAAGDALRLRAMI